VEARTCTYIHPSLHSSLSPKANHPSRVVNYTANYNPTGNSYLALYGFSQNPFVEFYVVEAFAAHNPSDNAAHSFYGYHTSDGAQYELWSKYNGNLRQYFSVRRTNRRGGTITFNNHYRAWAAAGLPLGNLQNTFIVVEGQQGTGNADITVGVRPTGSIKETATPTTRSAVCMTTKNTIGSVCKPRATKRGEEATLVKVARAEAVPTA
jgi:endo-1,4-beta-xylanase